MNQQKIWSYFQTETPQIFRGSGFRLYYLAKYLRPGQRVLNVGIGGGLFARPAIAPGADVITLDPDWASLSNHSAEKVAYLVAGRLETIPFETGSFDVVIVSEVLEHLTTETMRQALEEIKRILVPGGQIIGTVPCEENLEDATVVCPSCGEVFHKVGHLQSFDIVRMSGDLGAYFDDVECFERAFMAKAYVGWKEKIVDAVRNFLVLSGVLTRDKQLVFRGRKTA